MVTAQRKTARRDIPHQLSSSKDDSEISHDSDDDLRSRAHRRLARYPMGELVTRLERIRGDGREQGVDRTRLVRREWVEHGGDECVWCRDARRAAKEM